MSDLEKSQKETTALWWEYLKRSDGFKKFCNDIDTYCRNQGWNITSSDLGRSVHMLIGPWWEKFPASIINEKYVSLLSIWGNVHRDSFDEWWKFSNRMKAKERELFPTVSNYSSSVKDDLDKVVEKFECHNYRKPTLDEFKEEIIERLQSSPTDLYLKVNYKKPDSIEDIKRLCGKLIQQKRREKNKSGFKYERLYRAADQLPSTKIRLDELKRYLEIFDLFTHEKKSMSKVIEIMSAKTQLIIDERQYWRDLQKAKKIIKNVENGIFPGKY
jgi:hypothetical protein